MTQEPGKEAGHRTATSSYDFVFVIPRWRGRMCALAPSESALVVATTTPVMAR